MSDAFVSRTDTTAETARRRREHTSVVDTSNKKQRRSSANPQRALSHMEQVATALVAEAETAAEQQFEDDGRNQQPPLLSDDATSGATAVALSSAATSVPAAAAVPPKPTESELARMKFVLVTQTRGKHMIFLRYDDNEEFLGPTKENPQGGLLVTLRQTAGDYVVAPRFSSYKSARFIQQNMAENLGFTGRIFDSLITVPWSAAIWSRCGRSLFRLLQMISMHDYQRQQLQRTKTTQYKDQVKQALEQRRLNRQLALYNEYVVGYDAFVLWTCSMLDEYKFELMPRLLFLVFQHCYYDLVLRATTEQAVTFFRRFARRFIRDDVYTTYRRQVEVMQMIKLPMQMTEHEECKDLRLQPNGRGGWLSAPYRRVFTVSPGCLVYLQHNLEMSVHARIATVLRTYVDFQEADSDANIMHRYTSSLSPATNPLPSNRRSRRGRRR